MIIKILKYGQVKFLSIFLCALLLTFFNANCHAKWTVMVYMAGDNALDSSLYGEQLLKDLNEMELGIDTSTVRLVVLADRSSYGDTYIYNIQHDTDTLLYHDTDTYHETHGLASSTMPVSALLPSTTTNELNMGDPANLVVFSTWAVRNYPAENYMLILWNHGGGWYPKAPQLRKSGAKSARARKGIAWDNTDDDFLSMTELSDALDAITSSINRKFDIIGFDDCLMSQIEVAYQIKDYASYMIGCEELIGAEGWPYDVALSTFVFSPNSAADEAGMCVRITSAVYNSYNVNADSQTVTASAIDLSKINGLKNAVINFTDGLLSIRKMPSFYNVISTEILPAVDCYGMGNNDTYGGVDLYDLAYRIEHSTGISYMNLKSAASVVEKAVNDCVIANSTGPGHADSHGISINFPKSYEAWFEKNNPDGNYSSLKFAQDSNWNYFLDNFYNTSVFTPDTLFYVVSAPNPYNPNSGHLAVRNFPENSHIRLKIYALDGSLVRSEETDGEMIDWDGTNDSGSTVASGIYFYTAKTAAGTAKGKITVVKK